MTKEDIARMAREAGWFEGQASDVCIACSRFGINRFAELVAAHEREECTKVCEEQMKAYMSSQYTTDPLGGFRERFAAERCAAAIRVRAEK
jgi:hypothetical protein